MSNGTLTGLKEAKFKKITKTNYVNYVILMVKPRKGSFLLPRMNLTVIGKDLPLVEISFIASFTEKKFRRRGID